jgi:ferritin-like metal-binding protein YciE
MPGIESLTEVLVTELRDLYDAEKRLTKAIPRMAKKSTNGALRKALTDHLKETNRQVRRLEQAFRQLGERPRGKACAGMRGIIEEGDEHAGEQYQTEALRDAVIIGSAMRVEHYEMAAYMGAIEHARILGQSTVKDLLEATLAEEEAADKKLQAIGQTVNPAAATGDADQEDGGGRSRKSAQARGRKRFAKKR